MICDFIKSENFRSYSTRPYSTYSRHYEKKGKNIEKLTVFNGFLTVSDLIHPDLIQRIQDIMKAK